MRKSDGDVRTDGVRYNLPPSPLLTSSVSFFFISSFSFRFSSTLSSASSTLMSFTSCTEWNGFRHSAQLFLEEAVQWSRHSRQKKCPQVIMAIEGRPETSSFSSDVPVPRSSMQMGHCG